MRNKIILALLTLIILLPTCGCNSEKNSDPAPVEPTITQGDTFLTSGFKIKSLVTPQDVATLDTMTFEVYVDSNGNGSGLVGYKDKVYDVIIADDVLYVKVDDDLLVQVNNLTGHLIPTSLSVSGVMDLTQKGFTVLNDKVIAYKLSDTSMLIDGAYQSNDTAFEKTTVAQGNTMSISELINYILDAEKQSYIGQDDPVEVVPERIVL